MAARRARLTAAYGTVRIMDPATGAPSIRGFYQGAVFPDSADPQDVARLVRRDYAEWVDDEPEPLGDPGATIDEAPVVVQAPDVVTETPDLTPRQPTRPAESANKAAWVDYAVAMRDDDVSEADARAEAEAATKADLIAGY